MGGLNAIGGITLTTPAEARGLQGFLAAGGLPPALRSGNLTEEEKLRIAAQQFESVLMRTLIRAMRDTVAEGGLLPKGSGEKMFREMMDDQMAQDLSGRVGLGLSDAIVRQLSPAVIAHGQWKENQETLGGPKQNAQHLTSNIQTIADNSQLLRKERKTGA